MKKEDRTPNKNPSPEKGLTHKKSFVVALEQMAQLLRSEVKLKDRKTQILSASSPSGSLNIAIIKIARLLRNQVHSLKVHPKRSWSSSHESK